MPPAKPSRKSRFRAALALADMTAEQWAEVNDVTPGHLSHVLAEKRESVTLCEKIDEFTQKYLRGTVAA